MRGNRTSRRTSLVAIWTALLVTGLPHPVVDATEQARLPSEPRLGVYIVASGDSLWRLARRYGTTVDRLRALNGIRGSLIKVDQHLLIPGASTGNNSNGTALAKYDKSKWAYKPPVIPLPKGVNSKGIHKYKVRRGDSLSTIAHRYGTSVSAIMSANGLRGSLILVDQHLTIPRPNPAKASLTSPQNIQLLSKVINGEARGESYEGQVAVGAVVINRLEHPAFPKTIEGVIRQPGAFTALADGQYRLKPSLSTVNAAKDALAGWDPTHGALFFYNPRLATARWSRARTAVMSIGRHIFTQ